MVNILERLFPRLHAGNYRVTSPKAPRYNCIAWAAGDVQRWWWPERDIENGYWPETVPFEETLAAFTATFATLGFTPCDGEEFEIGFEKIALFADAQNVPTHAVRQVPGGRWTSKLGKREDIEHDLHDLSGEVYGRVVLFMKRPLPSTT